MAGMLRRLLAALAKATRWSVGAIGIARLPRARDRKVKVKALELGDDIGAASAPSAEVKALEFGDAPAPSTKVKALELGDDIGGLAATKICHVMNCARPVRAVGYCDPHYSKAKKYGWPRPAPLGFDPPPRKRGRPRKRGSTPGAKE